MAITKHTLSPNQKTVWAHMQFQPGSPVYNVSRRLDLSGDLDINALFRAIEMVVDRQPALRSVFRHDHGIPYFAILPKMDVSPEFIDLSGVNANLRAERASRIAEENAQARFDLENGPLFKATVIRLNESQHTLLLRLHHLVTDGWSIQVLYRELSAFYNHLVTGQPHNLPGLKMSYPEFLDWQARRTSGDPGEQLLAFWKQKLTGTAALSIPSDFPRPESNSFAGDHIKMPIPEEITSDLSAFCAKHQVTLYMLLAAVLKVALYRYTGSEDILFGSPVANRNHVDVEGVQGFVVNTIPVAVEMDARGTFLDLLAAARSDAMDAFSRPEISIERLAAEMKPERILGTHPFFQVLFTLQNIPHTPLGLTGISTLENAQDLKKTAMFDLEVTVSILPDKSMQAQFNFATALYKKESISRFATHFLNLLQSALATPEQKIHTLKMLADEERQRILYDWNRTDAPLTASPVHNLFEKQAAAVPDNIAVIYKDEPTTYRDFNQRANRIAHSLLSMGVRPGDFVCVYGDPDPDLIAGLVGILKAGCTYIPFAPDYPRGRMSAILEQAHPTAILTQSKYRPNLPDFSGPILTLDQDDWLQQSGQNPEIPVHPEGWLCIIFTSGSTGKPKGVIMPHRAVHNYVRWNVQTYPLGTGTRIQARPLTFDVSIVEIFAPLINGETMLIAEQEKRIDSDYLLDIGNRHNVTYWSIANSMLQMMLMSGQSDKMRSIPRYVIGGDALTPQLMEAFFEQVGTDLINMYGPTEATITVTAWKAVPGSPTISIGTPTDNTQLYILDEFLNPVPVGVGGELYIGGLNITHGYLDNPRATAENYLPDPFSVFANRMYRTGDKVRWLPDGNVEFLGRIDEQVKIRGFRIEPGEITALLNKHPGVTDAIVTMRGTDENQYLAAYIQPNPGAQVDAATLREHLQNKLPDYMVPAAFVFLDGFPVRSNGKINHALLPEPERTREFGAPELVAPATPTEAALAAIWQDVLKIVEIGVLDDFFSLGGHSLLAAQIVLRADEILRIRIPMQVFFSSPTIRKTAAWMDDQRNSLQTNLDTILSEIEQLPEN